MTVAALCTAERVPTFVRNLNALAEAAGMRVRVETRPYSNDPEVRLWSVWEGTKAQLRSLGLLTPRQETMLFIRKSAQVMVPSGVSPHCPESALLWGDMTIDGDSISLDINSGAWPCTIEQREGLEIVRYPDAVTYCGTVEALIAAGVDRKRVDLGKRQGICHWGGDWRWWASRRQPDGTVRYHQESEASMRRRLQEFDEYKQSQSPQDARGPSPERAAAWKQAVSGFCSVSIIGLIGRLGGVRSDRFRFERSDCERLAAIIRRFDAELLAELGRAQVVEAAREPATPQSLPSIIASRHPKLVASLAETHDRDQERYPIQAVCGFLARLERRFPRMRMVRLEPYRSQSVAAFVWEAQSVLEAGLLPPESLPQGPKRICHTESPLGWTYVTKRRGGLVEVRVCVPPDVPADHPLAFFSAASVLTQPPAPALRLVVDNARVRP